MKIKNVLPELIENDTAIIASFGNARLIKTPGGTCELVGGSLEDRALAGEWISLFMHELVLSGIPRKTARAKGSVALSAARLLE